MDFKPIFYVFGSLAFLVLILLGYRMLMQPIEQNKVVETRYVDRAVPFFNRPFFAPNRWFNRPIVRPVIITHNKPSQQPSQPSQPAQQPSQPAQQPSQPAQPPAQPAQPAQPQQKSQPEGFTSSLLHQ
jgi:hypothetical protein